MSAVEDFELRAMLAAQLHKANPADLDPFWVPIVHAANVEAQGDIRTALRGLGYAPDQIAGWDDFHRFNLRLGLFWCGYYGSDQLSDADAVRLKMFDCRKELADVTVTVDGVVVLPGATGEPQSASGALAASGCRYGNPLLPPRGQIPYPTF
jgi:hypothetical protein